MQWLVSEGISTHLKAILELLADKVEDDGVDAGVYSGQVDAKIIHDQQEAESLDTRLVLLCVSVHTTCTIYKMSVIFE